MTHVTSHPSAPLDKSWIALAALFLAAFVSLLDVTVVNLALPMIADELGATGAQSQWVLLAYLLPFASTLLPFGRFGDIFGRRRLFLLGVTGFASMALLAGMAQTISMLLIARVFQGLAAAAMMPQVLALTNTIVPDEAKARAIGYFGMVSALGAVAGPVVGGLVLTLNIADLGWRIVFLISVPFSLISAAVVLWVLPREPSRTLSSIDLRSAVLTAISIALVVFPMVQGRTLGWPVWIMAMPLVSLVIATLVVKDQLNEDTPGRIALIPIELLRSSTFLHGLLVMLLLFTGIAGVPFLLAIDLQTSFTLSPSQVACALIAHPLGAATSAYLAGRMRLRNHWLKPLFGAALTLLGIVLVRRFLLTGSDLAPTDLVIPLAFVGLGMGLTTVSLFQSTLAAVAPHVAGAASGMLQTAQQIGITISIAAVGALYFAALDSPKEASAAPSAAPLALWFPILFFILLIVLCAFSAHSKQRKLSA